MVHQNVKKPGIKIVQILAKILYITTVFIAI